MYQDEVTLCSSVSGIHRDRVAEFSAFSKEKNIPLIQVIAEQGDIKEATLLERLAEELGMQFIGEELQGIADAVLNRISPVLAIRHQVMPIGDSDGKLMLASADPFDWRTWDDLSQILEQPLIRVLCPKPIISKMLKSSFGVGAETVERLLAGRETGKGENEHSSSTTLLTSEEQAANEPTVVSLVNQILSDAIKANATDIHLEPYEDRYRIRYRVDGQLEDVSMPVSVKLLRVALVSRIKIMSNLDITEKRLPQDGRAAVTFGGQTFDLRISLLPGIHGEAVNIRLQSRQMVHLDLEMLGIEDKERSKIEQLISRPHGLILVTGPTGSGKTTTLYSCLDKINTPENKIITVEDPVEYWMENILQMQVHDEIGFGFARALRSMLRHDPDVMLVGEIRDRETADIAIRSSLTGHLVFATLHTNDAASAFTRLIDIGVEPFLVASSILGIIAQRLVRKVCPKCKRSIALETLDSYQQSLLTAEDGSVPSEIWEGARCEHCRFTGYRGRSAIAEVLLASSEIRRLVQQREPAEKIKDMAGREGMRSLRQAAIRAVISGRTSMADALRVTQEDS